MRVGIEQGIDALRGLIHLCGVRDVVLGVDLLGLCLCVDGRDARSVSHVQKTVREVLRALLYVLRAHGRGEHQQPANHGAVSDGLDDALIRRGDDLHQRHNGRSNWVAEDVVLVEIPAQVYDIVIGKRQDVAVLHVKFQVQIPACVVNGVGLHGRDREDGVRQAVFIPQDHGEGVVVEDQLCGQLFLQHLAGHVLVWLFEQEADVRLRVDCDLPRLGGDGLPDVLCRQLADGLDLGPDAGADDVGLIHFAVVAVKAVPALLHHLDGRDALGGRDIRQEVFQKSHVVTPRAYWCIPPASGRRSCRRRAGPPCRQCGAWTCSSCAAGYCRFCPRRRRCLRGSTCRSGGCCK